VPNRAFQQDISKAELEGAEKQSSIVLLLKQFCRQDNGAEKYTKKQT